LEAHLLRIPIDDYREIIGESVPGTNKNRSKAKKLRDFALPARFTEQFSKDEDVARRLRLHFAVVGDEYAWGGVDFNRLIRFHVISRDQLWTQDDLTPSSPVSDLHLHPSVSLIIV
jgi:hypothetical protein